MKVIVGFYLRSKHWQIFSLLCGIFIICLLIALICTIQAPAQSSRNFLNLGLLFQAVMMLYMICFLGWLGSMGSFLNSLIIPSLRMRASFFRFAFIYPVTYAIIAFTVFLLNLKPTIYIFIVPLHLLATFCMVYNLYFVSKSLTLVETGKPVSFYDYAGPFFLLWFFPIGIWYIQPKINRIYAQNRI